MIHLLFILQAQRTNTAIGRSKKESKHSDPSRSKASASWWTYPVSTCLSETLFASNLGVYPRWGDLWQADIWVETETETVGSKDTLEMKQH